MFIVLLPLIVLAALFGWMSGGESVEPPNAIQQQIQKQYAEQYPEHAEALEKTAGVFGTYGQAANVGLAQLIYISSELPEHNTDDSFYTDYAECFQNVTAEKTLTENITEAFGVSFSEKDAESINTAYKQTQVGTRFSEPKAKALEYYLQKQGRSVEQELKDFSDRIYKERVPDEVREYLSSQNPEEETLTDSGQEAKRTKAYRRHKTEQTSAEPREISSCGPTLSM